MEKVIQIPDSHFQRDPSEITSEEITAYYSRQRIPHPRFSTLSFPCVSCYAAVDVWCHKGENGPGRWDIPICEARKAMYRTAYDRYIEKVKNGSIQLYTTLEDAIRKQIQKILKEVKTEYDRRKEYFNT